jgi:predicted alternative tryptophan synthase beta-subunit
MNSLPIFSRYATILFAIAMIGLNSCAKIYYSPEARTRAGSHKLIAIAPPKVSIAAQKKVDPEQNRLIFNRKCTVGY